LKYALDFLLGTPAYGG